MFFALFGQDWGWLTCHGVHLPSHNTTVTPLFHCTYPCMFFRRHATVILLGLAYRAGNRRNAYSTCSVWPGAWSERTCTCTQPALKMLVVLNDTSRLPGMVVGCQQLPHLQIPVAEVCIPLLCVHMCLHSSFIALVC